MKAILLVTHSTMCEGVKASCEMIIGQKENLYTCALTEEGVDNFRVHLAAIIEKLEKEYKEVIIVTDIPNATPYNECYRYILSHKDSHLCLISGMNLAMVIELGMMSSLDMEMKQLVDQVIETGKISICSL